MMDRHDLYELCVRSLCLGSSGGSACEASV